MKRYNISKPRSEFEGDSQVEAALNKPEAQPIGSTESFEITHKTANENDTTPSAVLQALKEAGYDIASLDCSIKGTYKATVRRRGDYQSGTIINFGTHTIRL